MGGPVDRHSGERDRVGSAPPLVEALARQAQRLLRSAFRHKRVIPFAAMFIRKNRMTLRPLARPTLFSLQLDPDEDLLEQLRRQARMLDAPVAALCFSSRVGDRRAGLVVIETADAQYAWVAKVEAEGLSAFSAIDAGSVELKALRITLSGSEASPGARKDRDAG